MKRSSRNSSDSHRMSDKRQATCDRRDSSRLARVACCLLLVAALMGCESLQRKLTRKPKHPNPPPTPIISFEDYTRTMTPLDRYRKHYLMFDYWNSQLIEASRSDPINPKRLARASDESLAELETMRALVTDELAERFVPLIEARKKISQALQHPGFSAFRSTIIGRELEAQARQIHRELYWRDVEDRLKPQEAPAAATH